MGGIFEQAKEKWQQEAGWMSVGERKRDKEINRTRATDR